MPGIAASFNRSLSSLRRPGNCDCQSASWQAQSTRWLEYVLIQVVRCYTAFCCWETNPGVCGIGYGERLNQHTSLSERSSARWVREVGVGSQVVVAASVWFLRVVASKAEHAGRKCRRVGEANRRTWQCGTGRSRAVVEQTRGTKSRRRRERQQAAQP